ncbi:MAG: hypothetical protein KBT33_10555 [Prevotellaceae bacterium]|nr:hypothetical protein [Candidatus Minthosoma equi]
MKIKQTTFLAAIGMLMLSACGGSGNNNSLAEGASGDMDSYVNSDVNAIQQTLPQIMVIPADQTLKNFGALKETTIDGKQFIVRDYKKYLLADDRFPRLASFIQDAFNKQNYPLADFEQTLKQLDTQAATDMADGLKQDAKTQLLQTAQPDIILELNYYKSSSLTSHDYKNKNVSYTLTALDAYTNKSIATVTTSNIKGESTTEIIQNDLSDKLPGLMNDIQKYFSDILTRGREVTVRIVVDEESNVSLQDQSIEGDTYSDWVMDFIKAKAVKGACKMQRNTNNELYFVNVRIPLVQEDGTQYGVYDFTRDLQKNLRKNLGLQSTNNSQGLGEVVLTVKGI